MSKPGGLRETMPTVAGWVDELRAAFGAATVNAQIRAGIDGQPTFWARENGVEIGTPDTRRGITLEHIYLQTKKQKAEEAKRNGGGK